MPGSEGGAAQTNASSLPLLFERKNARNRESEAEQERTDALERTLGRVVVEKEFLIKKCKELGIES
jgi:hypothetical protein